MYIIVQDYQEKTVKHMTWNKYVIQWYDMNQSSGSAKATDPNTDRITPQKHEHVLPNTNTHRKDDAEAEKTIGTTLKVQYINLK